MKSYLTSIVAVCMIAVPAAALVPHPAMKRMVKLMGGLLLLLVVLRPLLRFDMQELGQKLKSIRADYQLDTDFLQSEMERQLGDYIKTATEAYVVREAEKLGALVQAEVLLSQGSNPQPVAVRLIGSLTPQQLETLTEQIAADLGVEKEEVVWSPYGADN